MGADRLNCVILLWRLPSHPVGKVIQTGSEDQHLLLQSISAGVGCTSISPAVGIAIDSMFRERPMTNTKSKILALFGENRDPVEIARQLTDDELERLLDGMRSPIPFADQLQANALSKFLYAGAARFDRWRVPTPYVVPTTHAERLKKFVRALRTSERGNPANCATFELHVIKNDVFSLLTEQPLTAIPAVKVEDFKRRVSRLQAPSQAAQYEEFVGHRTAVLAILKGLEDKTLRTRISTRIPYPIVKQPTEVQLSWHGLPIIACLTPEFRPSEESMMMAGDGAMISLGASRWQAGATLLDFTIEALIDGSTYTEGLQAIPGHSFPVSGWPRSFTLAFSVIHDLVWQLRDRHGGLQDWIPAPRDLSDVELFIETSSSPRLEYIQKGSPAALMQVFVPTTDVTTVDLGDLKPLSWFAECRIKAGMHLELGDTNEALFWLNVAVEALFAQRFRDIELAIGITGLVESLGSPKEFWADAEAIVAKQFPAMADKVKWPTAPIHVSVFGKLKVLYRRVKMQSGLSELQSRYRKISGNRNDLFHGKSTSRTPVQEVLTAIDALAWIDENMWPKSHPKGQA